mmetsp:Transcript_6451/g.11349  ORF Transcript_6451/g.11349 Transcript_6451/m.11349 type:complete len:704 (+) Transcript_6451:148-2259(+)
MLSRPLSKAVTLLVLSSSVLGSFLGSHSSFPASSRAEDNTAFVNPASTGLSSKQQTAPQPSLVQHQAAASSAEALAALERAIGAQQAAALSEEDRETAALLVGLGQEHLFAGWPAAGQAQADKARLLAQARDSDAKYPGGLAAYVGKARALLDAAAQGLNPFEGFTPSVPEGETLVHGTEAFAAAEEQGLLAACSAAFVLVAGGLGERLGYGGIKLELPVETATGRSYLQVYTDYILALQDQCRVLLADPALQLPLVIMTSDDTDAPTRRLLLEKRDLGMAPGQIRIIKQDKVPALADSAARLAVAKADPFALETKPHGHGDVHHLLLREGIAEGWAQEGREWVFFLQDTNALVINSVLPALGVSSARGFHMNSICIPRKAKEEAGAITALKRADGTGLIINVEYNQLDPLLRATVSPEGDANDPATGFSPYPGNANNLVFHLPTYLKVLQGKDAGVVTEFVNPKYKDATRTEFKKPTRLECMMQDFPKLMADELGAGASVGFTTLDKWLSFSPAKNSVATGAANTAAGTPPATISTAEAENYAAAARRLAEATGATVGAPVPVEYAGVTFELGPKVVLHPSFAVTTAQLRAKVRGAVKVSGRSALVLEGAGVRVGQNGLDLDGALAVRAAPGVEVVLDGLVVRNAGWEFRPLTAEEERDEQMAIRGYALERRETLEIVLTEPGRYRVGPDGVVQREVEVEAA